MTKIEEIIDNGHRDGEFAYLNFVYPNGIEDIEIDRYINKLKYD